MSPEITAAATAPAPGLKKVRIRLAALTLLEYSEVMEVPENATPEELQQLVEERYNDVDGGDYVSAPDYWERGTCFAQEVDPSTPASLMALRAEGGFRIERVEAADAPEEQESIRERE